MKKDILRTYIIYIFGYYIHISVEKIFENNK